jgi:hypothetical protein
MPRAAPGDTARVALRRNFPENLRVSASNSDRYTFISPYRLGMETFAHPTGSRSNKWCYFTLPISFFEVELGRLGEVVSLVGDCRTPPPGNPRRPTPTLSHDIVWDGRSKNSAPTTKGSIIITSKDNKTGEDLVTVWKACSFNNALVNHNLKKLNSFQYFKNKCSYFSCMGKKLVLKFAHLHSHLCGLRVVEPPSIAITNVL